MATRVDRTPGLDRLAESSLLRKLRLESPRRETDANFVGLKRSNALSDIDNPPKALDNILDKLSQIDVAERNLYGRPFNGSDWGVTGDFIDEQVDKEFLSSLSGTSIGGGSLGSEVSTSPRIRIEDRISLANSYFGEGSFPGLHSGPDAKFYRATLPEEIGYVKFSFTGSSVTVTTLRKPDKTTTLTVSEILGTETEVVLEVAGYELSEPINLSGSGISLRLVASGSVWTIAEGASSLVSILEILGSSVFPTVFFRLTRPYSVVNLPLWFTQAASDPAISGPGGADDVSTGTSLAVLRSEGGISVPDVAKGYWFSREYVVTRWTETERFLLGVVEESDTITEDSNMRWLDTPAPLRGEQYNWGVRWDGYLRITAGNYGFQVQTNVLVRIDMAVGSSPGYWVNVFDTRTNSAQENSDTYISRATFGTDLVDGRFKYMTGPGADDWVAYVPITIRMLRGGPDKAQPSVLVPSEPDMFIKTTSVPSGLTFYNQTHTVNLVGTDGSWSITGATLAQVIDVLEDPDASVTYRITARGSNIFTSEIPIALTTDGTLVSSTSTGFVAGSHTLVIAPLRTSGFENNLTALWKGRIASPGPGQRTYANLVSGSYTPDVQKVAYDFRPDWWKATGGNRYDRELSSSPTNTPLDGLLSNGFKSSLQSDVPGLGLYGNGSGVYSNRPNIIIGEARYGSGNDRGSSYAGLLLTPNLLGEGGKIFVNALPINSSVGTDANILGANDLGGDPNHKTIAFANTVSQIAQLYLWSPVSPDGNQNKYYLRSNLTAVSSSDNPTTIGLPDFTDPSWLLPVTVTATQVADNLAFTTNVRGFVAPLVLSVEKVVVNVGGTNYELVAFSTTLASILTGGSERTQFDTKYVRFYTPNNAAFQYGMVDSGEGISFSDVLKLTYNPNFNAPLSEIPLPPSSRVTPFGFDLPEFGGGLCYPPYAIGNPLLASIAISDTDLYNSKPAGNYNVFWGDHTKADLGGNRLELIERLEFSAQNLSDVIATLSPSELLNSVPDAVDYTHRLRMDISLDPALYDDDQIEHIGNGEKVKDSYYAYVKL